MAVVFTLLVFAGALISSAPLELESNNFVLLHTNSPLIRNLYKRDLSSLADSGVAAENPNEFADKDYDMELAEINVFRPVFRYRASYARRGG